MTSAAAPLQNVAAKPQPPSNAIHAGLLLQRQCACGSPTSSLTGAVYGMCEQEIPATEANHWREQRPAGTGSGSGRGSGNGNAGKHR